jgi:hypothetical protein
MSGERSIKEVFFGGDRKKIFFTLALTANIYNCQKKRPVQLQENRNITQQLEQAWRSAQQSSRGPLDQRLVSTHFTSSTARINRIKDRMKILIFPVERASIIPTTSTSYTSDKRANNNMRREGE